MHTRDDVKQCRLAGSIGADETDNLALIDMQVDMVEHLEAAERKADALDREPRPAVHARTSALAAGWAALPSDPPVDAASENNSSSVSSSARAWRASAAVPVVSADAQANRSPESKGRRSRFQN